VQKGLDSGKSLADIHKSIDMPWYKEWTTVTPAGANVEHVYAELTGRIMPWDLVEDFGIYEGPSPTKKTPGWTVPKRIVVPNLMPAPLAELKRIAPNVFFVPVKTAEEAAKEAATADAVLGFCTPEIVKASKSLRWIQVAHAGVEKDLSDELKNSPVVLTNTARIYGPNVADQAMALLLSLSRGPVRGPHAKDVLNLKESSAERIDLFRRWNDLKAETKPQELHGKTMLVVGLGGIGTQIARRAHAFGMRVMAVDPNETIVRPDFVFSIDRPAQLMKLVGKADVVVLSCPLTGETRGLMGSPQFQAMKKTAYLINIARGGIVKTEDLVEALRTKQIAGAGIDVTDPEPLPNDHPLWKLPNVAISPHIGGQSPEARDRQWRLWRENVRRFVAGEPLLCVVDKGKGY
jgi:phosphoglycerate dehydrogenase-like enzyme